MVVPPGNAIFVVINNDNQYQLQQNESIIVQ